MWVNSNVLFNVLNRANGMQNSVALNQMSVDRMSAVFNSIWGDLVDYSDSISSLRLYPIEFEGGRDDVLQTPKTTDDEVIGRTLTQFNSYYFLSQFEVKPHFNDFRDYTDATYIKVFLPFCGYFDIDSKECMGKFLQFRLSIDFSSGVGTYIIGVSDEKMNSHVGSTGGGRKGYDPANDSQMRVILTYDCQLGIDVPLGKSNAADVGRNLIASTVKMAGSTALSMYTAPAKTSYTRTLRDHSETKRRERAKGSRMRVMSTKDRALDDTKTTYTDRDNTKVTTNVFDEGVNAFNANIPYHQSDRPNGTSSMLYMSRNIHVVIYYKKYSIENDIYTDEMYKNTFGLPLGDFCVLGTLSGYTVVGDIHFESSKDDSGNISSATQQEVDEIISILKNGVIL